MLSETTASYALGLRFDRGRPSRRCRGFAGHSVTSSGMEGDAGRGSRGRRPRVHGRQSRTEMGRHQPARLHDAGDHAPASVTGEWLFLQTVKACTTALARSPPYVGRARPARWCRRARTPSRSRSGRGLPRERPPPGGSSGPGPRS
ncbi:hypothetical protein ACRAWD_29700 [Caulobacter segnis]